MLMPAYTLLVMSHVPVIINEASPCMVPLRVSASNRCLYCPSALIALVQQHS